MNTTALILEYFSDLGLIPIKLDDIYRSKEDVYLSGMFTFGESIQEHVYIIAELNDLSVKYIWRKLYKYGFIREKSMYKSVIHIYGASGSGTSTLGKFISKQLGL